LYEPFFNGTIDPMFPKTQTNFCNFIVEKSSIGKDEIMKLDENAVRQELIQRLDNDFRQEIINSLQKSLENDPDSFWYKGNETK
jgi:hypothetical protein